MNQPRGRKISSRLRVRYSKVNDSFEICFLNVKKLGIFFKKSIDSNLS